MPRSPFTYRGPRLDQGLGGYSFRLYAINVHTSDNEMGLNARRADVEARDRVMLTFFFGTI